MSIHSEVVVHLAEMTGDTAYNINMHLKPAEISLADANAHGFESIDEFEDAIREYVYG